VVYTVDYSKHYPLTPQLLSFPLQAIVSQFIRANLGYSSSIFAYKQPLCPFNKLDFLDPSTPFSELIQYFPDICFTFNNTLYCEEANYGIQPVYSRPPSKEAIEVVVQGCQDSMVIYSILRYLFP
jgi:hypothetical protein